MNSSAKIQNKVEIKNRSAKKYIIINTEDSFDCRLFLVTLSPLWNRKNTM